jgi:release factor glutamine methyltransferase
MPADVRNFEPKLALVAGEDGMAMIRELATQAGSRLREGGHLLVELSPMIAGRISEMLQQQGWRDVRTLRDITGHDRIATARR